ncbi:GtrA family protein [Mesorhizobium sp. KR9-304]|uniref:GtrA family protein n=1 Tax=Mesorhizobium sp. KR9-304 TaxID=3156614 RepID=UPI0032B33085
MKSLSHKFLRFFIVGTTCSTLFFATYFFLLHFAKLSLSVTTVLTYSICFFVGYFLQRNFTFRARGVHGKSVLRYLALHSFAMIFVYFTTQRMETVYGFGPFAASLSATAIAGIVSFVISLTWVFAERNEGDQSLLERP